MADTQTRPSTIKKQYSTWVAACFGDTTATAITPPTVLQWNPSGQGGSYATAVPLVAGAQGAQLPLNRVAAFNRIGALSASQQGLYALQLTQSTQRVVGVQATFLPPVAQVGNTLFVPSASHDVQPLAIPATATTTIAPNWSGLTTNTGLTFTINGIAYGVHYTTTSAETAANLVADINAMKAPGLSASAGGISTAVQISMTQPTTIGGPDCTLATTGFGLTPGLYTPLSQDGLVGAVPSWLSLINGTPTTTLVFPQTIIGVNNGAFTNYWMATQATAVLAANVTVTPSGLSAALAQFPVVTGYTASSKVQTSSQPAAVTDGSVTWTWIATVPNVGGNTAINRLILLGFSAPSTFQPGAVIATAGASSITLAGANVGDQVVQIIDVTTVPTTVAGQTAVAASFESTISVSGKIQQILAAGSGVTTGDLVLVSLRHPNTFTDPLNGEQCVLCLDLDDSAST